MGPGRVRAGRWGAVHSETGCARREPASWAGPANQLLTAVTIQAVAEAVVFLEVFLTTEITNARTEGTNRLIKQVKRAACGFRNRDNYCRRVRLHCTRQTRRLSARKPTVPA
jgi:hypothetical protein